MTPADRHSLLSVVLVSLARAFPDLGLHIDWDPSDNEDGLVTVMVGQAHATRPRLEDALTDVVRIYAFRTGVIGISKDQATICRDLLEALESRT